MKINAGADEAAEMDTISNVQNAIYEARIARFMYSNTGNEEFAAKNEQNLELALKLIEDGKQKFPELAEDPNIEKIISEVKAYQDFFKKLRDAAAVKNDALKGMTTYGVAALEATQNSESIDVYKHLMSMRLAAARYMATNDKASVDQFNDSYGTATNLASDDVKNHLANYKESFDKWLAAESDEALIQKDLVKAASDAQELTILVVNESKEKMESGNSTAILLIILFSVIASAFGAIISIYITRSLSVPMGRAMDFASQLSAGDFSKPLDIHQTDEIGRLASALEGMRLKLKEIIEGIIMSAGSLASGSTELASTTEELAATFADQAQQVTSVASAVEEISTSSSLVMDSIHEVSDKSRTAKDFTQEGQKNIVSANSVMGDIRSNVDELSKTVAGLAKSSEDIGNILLVINDIADQTNLLALNAAIEAARAGDHGRGFAVVADEVRKLAERTQQSTEEIKSIITQFIKETARTNTEMIEAGKKVQDGAEKLEVVDKIFVKIVDSVNEISAASSMITTAVQEQSLAIANINDNAQVISSGLEQSSTAIAQVSNTVADLQKQADDQMDGTKVFKI